MRRARLRLTLGGGLVLVLVAVAVAVLVTALAPRGTSTTVLPGNAGSTGALTTTGAPPLFVHVMGEVQHPGLYELREGDRVVDAIAAAGGFTDHADEAQVNLARFLSDGEQLVVLKQGEAPAAAPGGGTPGKVNINTADAAALEALPGIGPALADRILAWRDANGWFSSVDELLNVAGIGAKTLDGFRDSVTT